MHWHTCGSRLAALAVITLTGSATIAQTVVYVDHTSTGGANNGADWSDAFLDLQDGLAAANAGDEIRIADGVYTPDRETGDRMLSFALKNDVSIRGGYAGNGAADPNVRDVLMHETILSGDLAGDDGPDFANYADNSFHVATADTSIVAAYIGGVTITAGNATGTATERRGGGLYNDGGNPTLVKCTFRANTADFGGGMRIESGAPQLVDCLFLGNHGGTTAGGMYVVTGNAYLANTSFHGNTAGNSGGAMQIAGGDATVVNCVFTGNSLPNLFRSGGAIYVSFGTPLLANCSIVGNTATNHGGGMYVLDGQPNLLNCIIWGNRDGGGVDESAQIRLLGGSLTARFSCIQDLDPNDASIPFGGAANHNIDDPPLFLVPPDFGPDGEWDGVDDDYGDVRLVAGSPCADVGSNGAVPADQLDLNTNGDTAEPIPFDRAGNARFSDDPAVAHAGDGTQLVVDMGAYEYTVPAAGRVAAGLIALYDFEETDGHLVADSSGFGEPLDLTVPDVSKASRAPGTLSIKASTIVESGVPAAKIIDACKASNAVTLEAWVTPAFESQVGPARIVTLSEDTQVRNFTLGQEDRRFIGRLRTTTTSLNGLPALETANDLAERRLTHVVYTRAVDGATVLYVDGQARASGLASGDLSNWDDSYRLGLANEFTMDRTWLGDLHLVAIYDRALDSLEVMRNYSAGADRFGDSDADGDVDLADHAALADCLNGPDQAPAPAPPRNAADCLTSFDGDADGDVDLRDLAFFQMAIDR